MNQHNYSYPQREEVRRILAAMKAELAISSSEETPEGERPVVGLVDVIKRARVACQISRLG